MSFLGLLLKLGRAFDEAGVTWVVVKGPLLAEMAYCGSARCYSDLDVVVPAGQFRKALDVVIAHGARTIDRNWDLILRDPRGQLHLAFGPDLGLDLHWHLVNLANQRYRFAIPMEELFDRRRHVQLGPVGAWALDATDSVLHVTLHAALAGGHQLGWLVDIERSVANFGPDWETLVARLPHLARRAACRLVAQPCPRGPGRACAPGRGAGAERRAGRPAARPQPAQVDPERQPPRRGVRGTSGDALVAGRLPGDSRRAGQVDLRDAPAPARPPRVLAGPGRPAQRALPFWRR